MRAFLILVLVLWVSSNSTVYAYGCAKWGQARKIGQLDLSQVNEASGLQVSQLVQNRLYHVNDSGDGPNVYYSDLNGGHTGKFAIRNFNPSDVEALGMTQCQGQACLVVADIGDNREVRHDYSLHFIKEQMTFPAEVQEEKVVYFDYPDRSHNAEGIVFTKQGDLIIITKEMDITHQSSNPGYIFRLSRKQLDQPGVPIAEQIGRLDVSAFDSHWANRVPTDLSLNSDGDRLLVLNYKDVTEFTVHYDTQLGLQLTDPQRIAITTLEQQESIAYSLDGKSFIYDTEAEQPGSGAIMQVDCQVN